MDILPSWLVLIMMKLSAVGVFIEINPLCKVSLPLKYVFKIQCLAAGYKKLFLFEINSSLWYLPSPGLKWATAFQCLIFQAFIYLLL
jgi:hypothetical protein